MKKMWKKRSSRLNLLLAVLIVVFLAVFVLINAVAAALSDRFVLSADLTAGAVYDLGDETKEILDTLTEDVRIHVLASKGSFDGDPYLTQARMLLEKYPACSSHITLEYVDYMTDPTFAEKYPDLTLTAGDVLVTGPEAIRQIPLNKLFIYNYDQNGSLAVSGSRTEEAVTSAIVSAVTSDPVYVGILTGNAAAQDRALLEAVLADNNFEVSEVDLVTGRFEDYEILILLNPAQDLSEDVLQRFDAFLYNNGAYGKTLFYAAGAEQPDLPNMNVFLREWGVEVGSGAVFETDESHAYGYQPYYPFADYTDEVFRDLLKDSSKKVLMPVSKPLSVVFDYKDQKTVTTLLSFSEGSGVRPADAGNNFSIDQATVRGPIPAAVMSTIAVSGADRYSNVIVSASAQTFGQEVLPNTSIANAEYWMTVLNQITDRKDAVSIEPKSLAGNQLTISTAAARTWSILLCIVIPVLILLTGIAVYLRRRYQ